MSRETVRARLEAAGTGDVIEEEGWEFIKHSRDDVRALLAVADAAAEYQSLFHQDEWEDEAEYDAHDDNLQMARATLDAALGALDALP